MKVFLKSFAVMVMIAGLLVSASSAFAGSQKTHGIYGNWWTPAAFLSLGAEQGFFSGINVTTIKGGGASLAALAKGVAGAENGANSINTHEYAFHSCPPKGNCLLVGITTKTHPYEMISSRSDWLTDGILMNVTVGLSDCRQGHLVTKREDVIDGGKRYTADGLMMLYVVQQNEKLLAANLPNIAFFCGSRADFASAYPGADPTRVIFGFPFGDSPNRLAELGKGKVDMVLVTISIAARGRVKGGFVDAFDQSLLPVLPAAGIVMATTYYNTAEGKAYREKLCDGIAKTREWMLKNKAVSVAYFRNAYGWKGDAFNPELDRVYNYAITNMGGCTIDKSVMTDAANFVGGRSLDGINIAPATYGE